MGLSVIKPQGWDNNNEFWQNNLQLYKKFFSIEQVSFFYTFKQVSGD